LFSNAGTDYRFQTSQKYELSEHLLVSNLISDVATEWTGVDMSIQFCKRTLVKLTQIRSVHGSVWHKACRFAQSIPSADSLEFAYN